MSRHRYGTEREIDVHNVNREADVVLNVAIRIRQMRGWGVPEKDIHDEIVYSSRVPEDTYRLASKTADLMERWSSS